MRKRLTIIDPSSCAKVLAVAYRLKNRVSGGERVVVGDWGRGGWRAWFGVGMGLERCNLAGSRDSISSAKAEGTAKAVK